MYGVVNEVEAWATFHLGHNLTNLAFSVACDVIFFRSARDTYYLLLTREHHAIVVGFQHLLCFH